MHAPAPPAPWPTFFLGTRLFAPVAISIASYGVVWGVLAGQAGLSPLEVLLMSGLVYAGASQFVALTMWSPASLPLASIIVATAVINLRLMLMTATLRPQFDGVPRPRALAAMFLVSDEGWAMTMAEHAKGGGGAAFMLGAGTLAWIAWVGSTLTGRLLGTIIDDPAAYGLDFAFTATFIALLLSMWKGPGDLVPWLAGGLVAIGVAAVVPGPWYIIAGGLGGSLLAPCCSTRGRAMQIDSIVAILGMAAVTYAIRVGGFLVAGWLPSSGFIALWMRSIPGAVLAALVAPDVMSGGPAAWLAAGAAIIVYLVTRNVFATIVGGVLAMLLVRRLAGL